MIKAAARWVLGLDKNNVPEPQVVERVVERVVYRQAGCCAEPDPKAGWE